MTAARSVRVAIVGAGFGGIAAAAALTRGGGSHRVVLLEKAADLGGVWRDNIYPGCACDIPAPLYSYSFAPNPHWSARFPPHHEIQDYLRRCVADLNLDIRTGSAVESAVWDDSDHVWRIGLAGGEEIVADVFVPAVGQLSRPHVPELPGAASFRGPALHTARWDPALPLRGRTVAVIGTGASAIQLVPALAGRARRIVVFQRHAPWTLPKPDRRYGRARRWAYTKMPGLMRLPRAGTWAMTVFTGSALHGNRVSGAILRGISNGQRRWQVRDPELRAKVTPTEPMGCKRVLFTSAWLPTLTRDDVDLVTEPIITVTPTGVTTADGREHPCDVLVHGTGFAATDFLVPMDVTGRDGVKLADAWRDGASAYLGLVVPGFPNMFLVYGPNTNTGNTSVIIFHEAQARWIAQAVDRVTAGSTPLEVRPEVAGAYDRELQDRLSRSLWTACHSWYRTASGRIVTNWPGTAREYRRRTARLHPADFR